VLGAAALAVSAGLSLVAPVSLAAPAGAAVVPRALVSLRAGVEAVLRADTVTVVQTVSGATPIADTAVAAVIERPDRISLRSVRRGRPVATPYLIVIGDVSYSRQAQGRWTVFHHAGLAANFRNRQLLFLNRLAAAPAVVRRGDRYTVPAAAARSLLVSTGLPAVRTVTAVHWSATVTGGRLRSMTLQTVGAPNIEQVSIDVVQFGTSPPVTAPPSADVAPG
jgi:hypothetical protein